jgi:hypothetical protein
MYFGVRNYNMIGPLALLWQPRSSWNMSKCRHKIQSVPEFGGSDVGRNRQSSPSYRQPAAGKNPIASWQRVWEESYFIN